MYQQDGYTNMPKLKKVNKLQKAYNILIDLEKFWDKIGYYEYTYDIPSEKIEQTARTIEELKNEAIKKSLVAVRNDLSRFKTVKAPTSVIHKMETAISKLSILLLK